jgi:hypothetical protein
MTTVIRWFSAEAARAVLFNTELPRHLPEFDERVSIMEVSVGSEKTQLVTIGGGNYDEEANVYAFIDSGFFF